MSHSQCSKRPNPLKLTLVGISRFSGALVGLSRGSRHMTSLHVKTKHTMMDIYHVYMILIKKGLKLMRLLIQVVLG